MSRRTASSSLSLRPGRAAPLAGMCDSTMMADRTCTDTRDTDTDAGASAVVRYKADRQVSNRMGARPRHQPCWTGRVAGAHAP